MPDNPLRFTMQVQQCTNWCWAAVIASLSNVMGNERVTQGQAVNECVGVVGHDCDNDCDCRNDPNGACNQPYDIGEALFHYGFTYGPNGTRRSNISFGDIVGQIDGGNPIVFHIAFDDQPIGHVLVVHGYSGDDSLTVADPENGQDLAASFRSFLYVSPVDSKLSGTFDVAYFLA